LPINFFQENGVPLLSGTNFSVWQRLRKKNNIQRLDEGTAG
jgi:hypothetical protein